MLFNILKDHGRLFSSSFWVTVFNSIVLPIFNSVCYDRGVSTKDGDPSPTSRVSHSEGSTWDSETSMVATQCLVDLFVSFFDMLRSQLPSVVSVLAVLIRNPVQVIAKAGLNALVLLTGELGKRLSEDEWRIIFVALKEAIASTLPGFMKVLRTMDDVQVSDNSQAYSYTEMPSDNGLVNEDIRDDNLETAAYVVSRIRSHISVQLLIIKVPHYLTFYLLLFFCEKLW